MEDEWPSGDGAVGSAGSFASASPPPSEASGPKGKGKTRKERQPINVNIPANPYQDQEDSDEAEGESSCPRSGAEIILYMLESFEGNEDVRLMGRMEDLKQFRRQHSEPLEEAFARWDIIAERVRRNGLIFGRSSSRCSRFG